MSDLSFNLRLGEARKAAEALVNLPGAVRVDRDVAHYVPEVQRCLNNIAIRRRSEKHLSWDDAENEKDLRVCERYLQHIFEAWARWDAAERRALEDTKKNGRHNLDLLADLVAQRLHHG